MTYSYMARLIQHDEITGRRVTLELIRDEDHVELSEGDRFVTVTLKIDPWADPKDDQ